MLLDVPILKVISLKNGNAKIKINPFNKRIKIVEFYGDLKELLYKIQPLIEQYDVAKLFYIAPKEHINFFKSEGFIVEAKIEKFLNDSPGYFTSKFLTTNRKMSVTIPEEEEILIKAREYLYQNFSYSIADKFTVRTATAEDAEELAKLYDTVFQTYPTPLNDPEFIKWAINNNVLFKIILINNKIISAASADMDPIYLNAEMTDCATLNEYRNHGLMGRLIHELEKDLKETKYNVLYSMARAISPGMNIVFSKHNYKYGGRLINHCHICGDLEDMNIWIKNL